MDFKELLLTTSNHTQQWSACLWDPSTGSSVHYYKNGGVIGQKSVVFVGEDYMVTADEDKPMTHVWALNSQEPTKKFSTILPDKATALDICPRSCYLAVGVGVKLYIWHISSGKLFTVQKKNFQPITKVKFSSDGVFVMISGQDGMFIVYDLISLLSFHKIYLPQNKVGQVDPVYTKHDHTMPITDFHVGNFGFGSRVATVSSDNTCKLYELATGHLLLSLVFEEPLTSIVFDNTCWNLFVGTNSGKIQQFFLKEPPRPLEFHVTTDEFVFKGHQKRVTCLTLSVLTSVLVSGSDDNFVYIWDIISRQILRALEHKGAITNVMFTMNFENFFIQNLKPRHIIKTLDRDVNEDEEFVDLKIQDYDIELSDDEYNVNNDEADSSITKLKEENIRLRAVNKELFHTALKLSKKYNHVLK